MHLGVHMQKIDKYIQKTCIFPLLKHILFAKFIVERDTYIDFCFK